MDKSTRDPEEQRMEAQDVRTEMESTKKTHQWFGFAVNVGFHIENYVVPQYGDFPDPMAANWTLEKIQGKLESYVGRIGRGGRGMEEEIRDCLKIAHFACYLHALLTKGDAQK